MADWPATLPDLQMLGLTEQRQDGRLRSPMETGRAKTRRRFTAVVVNYNIPIIFTGAQKMILDDFFATTLAEGSLPFVWENPVDDTTVEMLIRQQPEWQLILGNANPNLRIWSATLNLEQLP